MGCTIKLKMCTSTYDMKWNIYIAVNRGDADIFNGDTASSNFDVLLDNL